MENHLRSILKAVSYRLVGSVFTFLIAYVFTSKIQVSGMIALTELTSKVFLFYVHERTWNLITWGRR